MLYSLVFALIYFAVLSIVIIFDMKNRTIKKKLDIQAGSTRAKLLESNRTETFHKG